MAKKKQKRLATTSAFKRFLKDADEIIEWLSFLGELVKRSDENAKIAAKALITVETDKDELSQLRKSARHGSGAMKQHNKFRKLLREVVSVRLADSYICYLTELLTILHENKKELLRTKSTITMEEILSFEKIEDLHGYLIEKRVIDLSYKGIGDLNAELSSKLNFSIFKNKSEKQKISYLLEVRNLLVHNRGKIDRRFIKNTGGNIEQLGNIIDLDDPVGDLSFALLHALSVDRAARKKFKIKPVSYIPAIAIKFWKKV